MYLGYNTNGLAHHDLYDAVALLGDLGYRGVAITIDHASLSPRADNVQAACEALRRRLTHYAMRTVIETGARFLLNHRDKHEPTLVSADRAARQERIAFYRHAIDCAAALDADCVSLWSGILRDGAASHEAFDRLAEGLWDVLEYAAASGVRIALEPEPGMLVDSMAAFEMLLQRVDTPELWLTLDLGHLHCQGECPIVDVIHRWAPRLVNVHIEDMRAGIHEHLMFGDGEIDFPPLLRALTEVDYAGGVYVELSRHSHEAPTAARRAFEFLSPLMEGS